MAGRKHDKRGRSKGMENFVALPRSVLRSPAFRALSATEKCILIAVAFGFNGRNNGSIKFGARHGEAWGTGKSATAVALKNLTDVGFLKLTQPGTFTTKRLVAEYAITWHPPETGGPAGRDFEKKPVRPVGQVVRCARLQPPSSQFVRRDSPQYRTASGIIDEGLSALPDTSRFYQEGVKNVDLRQPAERRRAAREIERLVGQHQQLFAFSVRLVGAVKGETPRLRRSAAIFTLDKRRERRVQ